MLGQHVFPFSPIGKENEKKDLRNVGGFRLEFRRFGGWLFINTTKNHEFRVGDDDLLVIS